MAQGLHCFLPMQARTTKTNTDQKRTIQMDWQDKENKMKNKNNAFAIVVMTIALAATTVLASVDKDSTAAVPQTSKSTVSHSFTDGNISCDGKTGWQMIAEQVANFK